MIEKLITRGKKVIVAPQSSILSAASVIMVMVIASAVLGFVRDRIMLAFFVPEQFSLFRAAFRFPDLFTGILTLGTLSSAFIPVFSRTYKDDKKQALDAVSRIVNLGILMFAIFLVLFLIFAEKIYGIVAPGFSKEETFKIAQIAKIIFISQGVFVISYSLTGVLESSRRFLIPAVAPVVYNLGIIFGTVLLSSKIGLFGPAIGVVVGAIAHFGVQMPLALKLGYRFGFKFRPNKMVKKIIKLAAPRMFELSVLQGARTVELFLASFISTASYGYYSLAMSVKALPVSLFGLSLAKAALPTLSRRADDKKLFSYTLIASLYQVVFLSLPLATIFIVLRIPIVRLLFGTAIFDWPSTVQTSLVLSTFAVAIPFEASVVFMNRAFWALQDTKTPVIASLTGAVITVITGFILILGLSLPTWALAAAFAIGTTTQGVLLFIILAKRLKGSKIFSIVPFIKSAVSSLAAGLVMFFLIKIFDRAVWVKRLSFIGKFNAANSLPFESFVIDTRYTFNLLVLTVFVAVVGTLVYLGMSYLLRSNELMALIKMIKRGRVSPLPKDPEPLSPPVSDSIN